MSTCKNCIRYELCADFNLTARADYNRSMQIVEGDGKPERCGFFKDRSKFVELPCKAGDYVYFTNAKGVILESKIVCVRASQSILNFNPEHIEIILGCEKSRGLLWLNLDKTKNVYFSYEEAEQALKERDSE